MISTVSNQRRLFGRYSWLWLILAVFFAGCSLFSEQDSPPQPSGEAGRDTPLFPDLPSATPASPPTPTTPPRVLTICLANEPDTLYLYGGASLAQKQVLEALYDGPIDRVGYQFQPVILEKLPDLADGDAALEPAAVEAGDWVVNDAGELVQLALGEVVRPSGCAAPECAVPWDGNPLEMDRLSASFTIKEGILWSDDTPLTAADSVFSYELARQCRIEGSPCGGLGLITQDHGTVERTASYTALDDRRVRWTGVPGFRDPNYPANFFIPLPAHQLGARSPEKLLSDEASTRQPLGWGPYLLESWVPGDHIRLRSNPLFFRAGEGLPAFDVLILRFFSGQTEQLENAVLSGSCDLLDQSASQSLLAEDPARLLELDQGGSIQALFVAGPVWEQADFGIRPLAYDDGYQPANDRPDLFGDPRTRQGIALCMDRQRVTAEVLNDLSSVPASYYPSGHPLLDPDLPVIPHDPAAGADLLAQAGWTDADGDPTTPRTALGVSGVPDGTPLAFSYLVSDASQRLAAANILAESLAECGVAVDLQPGPAVEVYAPGPDGPVFGRRFDMAQFAWESSIQPPCYLWSSQQVPGDPNLTAEDGSTLFPFGWGGVNASGYADPEFDQACQASLEALPGEPGYIEAHHRAQALFAAALPAIPLYEHLRVVVSRPDLCNLAFDPSSATEFWNLEAFDFREECRK